MGGDKIKTNLSVPVMSIKSRILILPSFWAAEASTCEAPDSVFQPFAVMKLFVAEPLFPRLSSTASRGEDFQEHTRFHLSFTASERERASENESWVIVA